MFFTSGWIFSGNSKGIKSMIDFWKDYSPLICLSGAVLTLFVANRNLMKHIDIETINSLSILRDKLNSDTNKDIHSYLCGEEPQRQTIIANKQYSKNSIYHLFYPTEIYNYLGTLELGAIMLLRKAVTYDEFYNQFGYRIESIKGNTEIMKHINSKDNKKYYRAINYAIKQINKHN